MTVIASERIRVEGICIPVTLNLCRCQIYTSAVVPFKAYVTPYHEIAISWSPTETEWNVSSIFYICSLVIQLGSSQSEQIFKLSWLTVFVFEFDPIGIWGEGSHNYGGPFPD